MFTQFIHYKKKNISLLMFSTKLMRSLQTKLLPKKDPAHQNSLSNLSCRDHIYYRSIKLKSKLMNLLGMKSNKTRPTQLTQPTQQTLPTQPTPQLKLKKRSLLNQFTILRLYHTLTPSHQMKLCMEHVFFQKKQRKLLRVG